MFNIVFQGLINSGASNIRFNYFIPSSKTNLNVNNIVVGFSLMW